MFGMACYPVLPGTSHNTCVHAHLNIIAPTRLAFPRAPSCSSLPIASPSRPPRLTLARSNSAPVPTDDDPRAYTPPSSYMHIPFPCAHIPTSSHLALSLPSLIPDRGSRAPTPRSSRRVLRISPLPHSPTIPPYHIYIYTSLRILRA
ncbi:hypothetical protein A0H81_12244 [Grifola frondosa]|uniref:Uncharacterized protein n=1 Tax=Grifola frondosa TaxID=5627 RepID=A0A1C7LSA1_GRIFR|nr:hypothetical protein A0H81_12244 [Grifola frondosa]